MKKNYFITGGTGSFAKYFIEDLIKKNLAKKIVIFSRDEYKQSIFKEAEFVKKNHSKFRFYIGDVRDDKRLDWALNEDIDIVVHSAALKQVPTTEYNPFETVKTNIIGTQNLIETCIKKNIDKTILISTDKAVAPINLYGSTKLTAEKLIISANSFKGKRKCKFSVIRYGNVMGSRGSVIPILIEFPECDKHFEIKFCAEIVSFSKELSKRVIPFARATLLPFIISLNKSIYFTAITEISTFTFFGNTETSTASLAGGFWEK